MRQRQPGVNRKERDFDRESGEKREKNPQPLGAAQLRLRILRDAQDVEAAGAHAQINHAGQREDRPGEGHEEEFPRGVAALRPAPDADDEEHRNQRELKEKIEQQQIARDETSDHRHQQQKHPGVIFFGTILNRQPA